MEIKSARSRKRIATQHIEEVEGAQTPSDFRIRIATQQTEEVEGVQTPSDFRIRDYGLDEVLFRSFGFNIYMLQGK